MKSPSLSVVPVHSLIRDLLLRALERDASLIPVTDQDYFLVHPGKNGSVEIGYHGPLCVKRRDCSSSTVVIDGEDLPFFINHLKDI